MILQHPIHYDDFDDEVLDNITGHRCIRGNWTLVDGLPQNAWLVDGELQVAPLLETSIALRTDALESDDVRLEALGIVRGDVPVLWVYLRWSGNLYIGDWLSTTFFPDSNLIRSVFASDGEVAVFDDSGFSWNVGDEIFMEIIAIQRDITFRTTNQTSHYTARFDYRIPDIYSGFPHYAGLGLRGYEDPANVDSAFDYFKVFPAGEPTP